MKCEDCVSKDACRNTMEHFASKRALQEFISFSKSDSIEKPCKNFKKASDYECRAPIADWIHKEEWCCSSDGEPLVKVNDIYICSKCGRAQDKAYPYCTCGAKMGTIKLYG